MQKPSRFYKKTKSLKVINEIFKKQNFQKDLNNLSEQQIMDIVIDEIRQFRIENRIKKIKN